MSGTNDETWAEINRDFSDGCYSPDGEPCTLQECSEYRRTQKFLKQEDLPSGVWVSTVYLGFNHRFGDGPPLIFETMVFPGAMADDGSMVELDVDRYSSKEAALAGHQRMVEKWSGCDHRD